LELVKIQTDDNATGTMTKTFSTVKFFFSEIVGLTIIST